MTRRRVLVLAVALLAALASLLTWRGERWRRLLDALGPRLDPTAPMGALAGHEMAAIVAFAEVLVEGRPLSEAERRFVAEHVDRRTRAEAGYLPLYRGSAALLDRLAGVPFAALPFETRTELTARHGLGDSRVRRREYLWPPGRSARAVRALAVPDLIRGYYASPAGWAVVGYQTFPGRCGGLVRYTVAEG